MGWNEIPKKTKILIGGIAAGGIAFAALTAYIIIKIYPDSVAAQKARGELRALKGKFSNLKRLPTVYSSVINEDFLITR